MLATTRMAMFVAAAIARLIKKTVPQSRGIFRLWGILYSLQTKPFNTLATGSTVYKTRYAKHRAR